MILSSKNDFSFWQFKSLAKQKDILHFVSYKDSFGRANQNTLNFRNTSPDFYDSIAKIAFHLEIAKDSVYISHQTHSKNVLLVHKGMENKGIEDVDAFVTDDKEVCIIVKSADCVPILLYDTKLKVIAAVHAGWRSTVKRILELSINTMTNTYQSNPENIIACIGPSICMHCYEIGPEIVEIVKKDLPYWDKIISYDNTRSFLNLQEANKQQLLKSGIRENNIEIAYLCTYEHTDLFYSARKEGSETGRIISGILLK
ncbi:MAG: peptidoglycan editing factor PgeF [Bacteroidales bacterium]|nr:peptidoglycan editing factor PgeF [Bacteroidales bacterium]